MVLDDLGAEPGAAALMGSADPRVAAQARAQQRKKGKSKWGDTAFGGVEDVARAEEDFQGEEEEQEAMEPFNLQQEREEGYFDAEGNYVEYREDTEATVSAGREERPRTAAPRTLAVVWPLSCRSPLSCTPLLPSPRFLSPPILSHSLPPLQDGWLAAKAAARTGSSAHRQQRAQAAARTGSSATPSHSHLPSSPPLLCPSPPSSHLPLPPPTTHGRQQQRWAPPWPPRQQHDPSTHTHSSTSMEDGSDADDWEEPARHAANGAAEAIGNDSAEAASPAGTDRRDSPSRDDSQSQSPSRSSRSLSSQSSRSSASSRSSHSDAESEDRGAGDERREGNGEREEEKEGGYDGEGLDGDVKGSGVEESTGRDPQGDAREGGEQGGMADGGTGLGVTLDFDEDDGSDYSESSDGEGGGSGSDRSGEEWQVNEGGEQEHASGVKRKERGAGEAAEGDERPAKRMEAGEGGAGGAEGEGLLVRVVADHYSRRDNQQRHEREASPIIHLKKLNNWIKSVLIRLHTHPARGARVLDLACAEGRRPDQGSVHDAMARYNGDSHRSFAGGDGADSDRRQMRFPAKLACADCFGVALDRELLPWAPFDICSTQFALHYSFETEQRARCGLRNIAALLRPGGMFIGTIPDANVLVQKLRASPNLRFGNSVYSIEFAPEFADKKFPSTRPYGIRYEFRLEDAVDCPEWLVPFAFLQRLAGEYGLQALYHANFHTFIKTHAAVEPHASLLRRIAGERWREEMTADEWDAAYLYCVFVFRKEGQGGLRGVALQGRGGRSSAIAVPCRARHTRRHGRFPPPSSPPPTRALSSSCRSAAPPPPALACVSPPPPLASLLSSLSLALPALSACFSSPLPPPPPLLPIPTARQLTRQRAELAAFFHVGMNTFTDREWGTGREDPRLFNPAALNASQWVDTVKAAGFQFSSLIVRIISTSSRIPPLPASPSSPIPPLPHPPSSRIPPLPASPLFPTTSAAPLSPVVQPHIPPSLTTHNPSATCSYLNHGDVAGTDWMPAECDVSIRPGWFWHPSERPKPLARLLDLYFASVGRGCALLLNVPPNTTGLLHGEDVQRVGQFGPALQVLFQEDVSAGARVLASSVYGCEGGGGRRKEERRGVTKGMVWDGVMGMVGGWVRGRGRCDYGPENVLSAGDATFWAAQDGVLSATLEFDLGQGKTFHVVRLEEPVAYGQRIKSFTVEVIDPDPAAAPAAAPAAPVAQVGGAGAGGCGPGGCNTEDGVLPSLPGVPSLGEPALHTSHGPQAAARSMLERTGSAGRAGEWRVVARGSTVGRKRLFRLEAVRAQHVRLVIHDARAAPLLSFFALYRSGDLSTI
ncbi:unnamed protein product [Closterium sp. Yama58-4]|nr:unnamed protein product [Closterium sp. Yama58-4]